MLNRAQFVIFRVEWTGDRVDRESCTAMRYRTDNVEKTEGAYMWWKLLCMHYHSITKCDITFVMYLEPMQRCENGQDWKIWELLQEQEYSGI